MVPVLPSSAQEGLSSPSSTRGGVVVPPRIAIVKYGVGNVYSVLSGLRRAGAAPEIIDEVKLGYDAYVLPGVGAFKPAASRLLPQKDRLLEALDSGVPVLGICLGLQLFYEWSSEWGGVEGLGLLEGRVERIPAPKLPHIGWTRVYPVRSCSLLESVEPGSYFYFVHSYYAEPRGDEVCAKAEYSSHPFPAVVEKPPIYATQFHPERSNGPGKRVLENFVRIVEASNILQ